VNLTQLPNGHWGATVTPNESPGGIYIVILAGITNSQGQTNSTGQDSNGTIVAPATPIVSTGGVTSGASYANSPTGPGTYVSVFGGGFAGGGAGPGVGGGISLQPAVKSPSVHDAPTSVLFGGGFAGGGGGTTSGISLQPAVKSPSAHDAPTGVQGTVVMLGDEALPLTYAGDSQINAIIPYDAPVNATLQLYVVQNGQYSAPAQVVIAAAQPAVFTQDGSGQGAGAIVVAQSDGTEFLNTPSTPASAGDALVIYCTGLGAVSPAVTAGTLAPSTQYTQTTNPVTVTVGGQIAAVFFAGLTPGFTGLYQVNAYVPVGVATGAAVPVVVSVAGISSPAVTVAIQ
jgi:uncharacterized protein (TIGR03437 family)